MMGASFGTSFSRSRSTSHESRKFSVPSGSARSNLPTCVSYSFRQSNTIGVSAWPSPVSSLALSRASLSLSCHSSGGMSYPARCQSSGCSSPSATI